MNLRSQSAGSHLSYILGCLNAFKERKYIHEYISIYEYIYEYMSGYMSINRGHEPSGI